MKTIRKFFHQVHAMSDPAYVLLKACVLISIAFVLIALVVLLHAGVFTPHTYKLHLLAKELYTLPAALLLLATIAAAWVEEQMTKN